MKVAIKWNAESAMTSDEAHFKMAKVFETLLPIVSTSGILSKDQPEPMAKPPVILNDLSNPSETQNTIEECENCTLMSMWYPLKNPQNSQKWVCNLAKPSLTLRKVVFHLQGQEKLLDSLSTGKMKKCRSQMAPHFHNWKIYFTILKVKLGSASKMIHITSVLSEAAKEESWLNELTKTTKKAGNQCGTQPSSRASV